MNVAVLPFVMLLYCIDYRLYSNTFRYQCFVVSPITLPLLLSLPSSILANAYAATVWVVKCYFFEENNQTIIMDSECSCTILETFLATELQEIRRGEYGFKRMLQQSTRATYSCSLVIESSFFSWVCQIGCT